ncbi:hypothetical protein [Dysgonomonas sp. 216]|uniref:hypothetical protein n=1 Tax=Dysgonomonas sp. 216 TaxID=2302934 RepID=UPI0013D6E488|nr:hypothetical protein [Dysgonomonas sp. 216]
MPVTIQKEDSRFDHPPVYCYSVTQEVYCWQVAPQQSPIPLQLPEIKIAEYVKLKK